MTVFPPSLSVYRYTTIQMSDTDPSHFFQFGPKRSCVVLYIKEYYYTRLKKARHDFFH